MARRRRPARTTVDALPERLREFVLDDWLPEVAAAGLIDPPAPTRAGGDWGFGVGLWREIQARMLWRDAGREWLAARVGDPADWYRLTHPPLMRGVDYEPVDGSAL